MRVICDFDGTITRQDTTDWVLEHLATPEWRDLEADWLAGRMTAAECMRRQIGLIQGADEDLDAALERVDLDPGFIDFVDWCESRQIPVSIVSDGVDVFIGKILRRHGLDHLPVVANALGGEAGARELSQPYRRDGCAAGSGVCKCAAASTGADRVGATVFIGDGRSDFCVAGRADVLFAKGVLADYATARNQAFLPFDTFYDVRRSLAVLLGEARVALPRAATS